ncbi:trypsin-like peptidase domain-containing protein [Thermodesulfobacteriota bacterium]
MISLKKTILYLIVIFSMVCVQDVLGGKLYKWVDKDGVVHFSDRKPDNPEGLKDLIQEREVKEISPVKSIKAKKVKTRAKSPIEYTTDCSFTIKGAQNLGTGFFISSNGYAVTCKHVIEEGNDHMAVLNDHSKFPVGVISTSDKYDLALILVITSQKTPYLSLRDPETMVPGERVLAIGSSVGLQSTVTDGLFTGLRTTMPMKDRVIQFSAPINPGNSGGPLIDEKGKAIGVVSWKIISNKGIPVTGVGFAIPSGYLIDEYSAYMEEVE